MNKEVSIVRVDTRHHRVIAQENWGLTDKQMKGKHVHHRIPVSRGGTNDPSNLYVCSPWFHKNCWHAEDSYNSLIPYAEAGGIAARDKGLGIHGLSEEERRVNGKRGGEAGGWKKSQERSIGIFGDRAEWRDVYVESGQRVMKELIERNPNHQKEAGLKGAAKIQEIRVGIHAPGNAAKGGRAGGKVAVESGQLTRARTPESVRKGGVAAGNTLYADPDHPELGHHNAGVLVRKQRKLGYPSEKENRRRIG